MSGRLKLLAGAALGFGILIGVTQVGFAEDALTSADSTGWAMYGRTYDNTRFSPLSQINTENVGQIKLAIGAAECRRFATLCGASRRRGLCGGRVFIEHFPQRRPSSA